MFLVLFFTPRMILDRFLGSVGRFGPGGRGVAGGEMPEHTRDFQGENSNFSNFPTFF